VRIPAASYASAVVDFANIAVLHIRRGLAAIAIAIALSGCGSPLVPPAPATAQQLAGPWRPMPLSVGPETRAEFDAACRADPEMADDLTLVVIDARGEGRLVVGYVGPGGSDSWLEATIGAEPPTKCQIMSKSDRAAMLPLAERELRFSNVSSTEGNEGWWSVITGRAGADIDQVIAEVPGSPRIVATLADGWFALWWPEEGEPRFDFRLLGLDEGGAEIAELKNR
jgi:hypothetical protein